MSYAVELRNALKPGDHAPDFNLSNVHGRKLRLNDLRRNGPVVLAFFRGLWCPCCNADLLRLQDAWPAIQEAGASLVAISPQRAASSRQAAADLRLDFPILQDDRGIAEAYGLSSRENHARPAHAADAFQRRARTVSRDSALPLPAHFVVERDGAVGYATVYADYRMRGDPDRIVSHLLRRAEAV